MKKIIVVTILLFTGLQAAAVECNNAQTQSDMNECAAADYKKADKELNSTYQQVLKKTSDGQKNLLKSAQQKWINYRDADCKFQTQKNSDGSASQMVMNMCLQNKTEQRTKELKEMISCPEGDIGCSL